MATRPVHMSFEPDILKFIKTESAKRHYKGVSEFTSEIMRKEMRREEARIEFLALMAEGMSSPECTQPMDAMFAEIHDNITNTVKQPYDDQKESSVKA